MATLLLCHRRTFIHAQPISILPPSKVFTSGRFFTSTRVSSKKLRTKYSGPVSLADPRHPTLGRLGDVPRETYQLSGESTPSTPQGVNLDSITPYPNNDLSSTRPTPLCPPEPPQTYEFQGRIPISVRARYLYRLGRAYLGFYKAGLKNIWSNYKEYRKIKARLGRFPVSIAAKYGGKSSISSISRREYQLYLRTRHDLKKLVPFGLIFCIFGEFTPLVILAFGSSVVPYTCRIPRQITHDREKIRKRFSVLGLDNHEPVDTEDGIDSPSRTRLAYMLGCSPTYKVWPVIGPFLYHKIYRPALERRQEELFIDMILIHREGGIARLEPEEVIEHGLTKGQEIAVWLIDALESGQYDASPGVRQRLRDTMQKDLDRIISLIKDNDATFAAEREEWLRKST